MSLVAILGAHYQTPEIAGELLVKEIVKTNVGEWPVYRYSTARDCYVIFRHGLPYQYLPHEIPYEAHAALLAELDCQSLLLTSSVGVLTQDIPLFSPLLVTDLMMLDNRLPNGKICTLTNAHKKQHLVFRDGPFSSQINQQIRNAFEKSEISTPAELVYSYFPGPRTKTRSENRLFSLMGAHVNSMTMGPEVVLANELGIPTAAIVVGHKYSLGSTQAMSDQALADSLVQSKSLLESWVTWFFSHIKVPAYGNLIYEI